MGRIHKVGCQVSRSGRCGMWQGQEATEAARGYIQEGGGGCHWQKEGGKVGLVTCKG